jgi:hypothetical protein
MVLGAHKSRCGPARLAVGSGVTERANVTGSANLWTELAPASMGDAVTSGTITDELINEYINEQEGELSTRTMVDLKSTPLEPLAFKARVVQLAKMRGPGFHRG